ncbi:hypothetical protein ACTPOK_39425 [Streptomyces inhibens]|uniref:hypothetical protein n=1 Tax=Streptomyces inhibens TaxID=2293571 RepID=UPI00402A92DE
MSRIDAPGPKAGPHRHGRLGAYVRVRAGGLPDAFWVLWGGSLVNRLGSMVNPFLSLYLTGVRGVSTATPGSFSPSSVSARSSPSRSADSSPTVSAAAWR